MSCPRAPSSSSGRLRRPPDYRARRHQDVPVFGARLLAAPTHPTRWRGGLGPGFEAPGQTAGLSGTAYLLGQLHKEGGWMPAAISTGRGRPRSKAESGSPRPKAAPKLCPIKQAVPDSPSVWPTAFGCGPQPTLQLAGLVGAASKRPHPQVHGVIPPRAVVRRAPEAPGRTHPSVDESNRNTLLREERTRAMGAPADTSIPTPAGSAASGGGCCSTTSCPGVAGAARPSNLRLRCGPHSRLLARRALGDRFMDSKLPRRDEAGALHSAGDRP